VHHTAHREEGEVLATKLLTTTEASALLGVMPRTVTHYIERGLIEATKYGRDWLIEEGELRRFQEGRRQVGRPREKADE
jgi:excisionase family DNA binding protein